MKGAGRWGGGSADKSDTGENKSQAHIQTLWIRRTSRIYPLKNVVLVGCNSVKPNLSSTGGEVEALNVGTFSGFCLACEASLRTTAQHKTGQAAPERHNSRKKGLTCQNTTLAKL